MIKKTIGALLCLAFLTNCANHSASTPLPVMTPIHFALLLPLSGQWSMQGAAVRDGFFRAYYESPMRDQQTISIYNTADGKPIREIYQQALSEGANFVIGPLVKNDTKSLLMQSNFIVPTLNLNYTTVSWGHLPNNFYEFGLSPVDEAQQIANQAWKMGYRHALIIAPQDDWGQHLAKPLLNQWEYLGGRVTDSFYYTPTSDFTTGIPHLLEVDIETRKIRQDIDVIFLLAQPSVGRTIVPLLKYNYANHIPIYASSAIYAGIPDSKNDVGLNGVYFCDIPWILNIVKQNPLYRGASNRLMAVGYDAYFLSSHLSQLIALPNVPLYGETGALTLTPSHHIYRQLSWSQMREGRPQ